MFFPPNFPHCQGTTVESFWSGVDGAFGPPVRDFRDRVAGLNQQWWIYHQGKWAYHGDGWSAVLPKTWVYPEGEINDFYGETVGIWWGVYCIPNNMHSNLLIETGPIFLGVPFSCQHMMINRWVLRFSQRFWGQNLCGHDPFALQCTKVEIVFHAVESRWFIASSKTIV